MFLLTETVGRFVGPASVVLARDVADVVRMFRRPAQTPQQHISLHHIIKVGQTK